jgi:hypothetical protein
MRIILLILLTFCFNDSFCSDFKTEDLGSVKKEGLIDKKSESLPKVDYRRLKKENIKKEDDVLKEARKKNINGSIEEKIIESNTASQIISSDREKEKTPFYKSLGGITIRASEDYVYIRAGKSAIIMNADGKIIIDSAKDLFLTSQGNLVFKAKGDIVLRAGQKIDTGEARSENSIKDNGKNVGSDGEVKD